jgi:hypothetical protein
MTRPRLFAGPDGASQAGAGAAEVLTLMLHGRPGGVQA